MSFGDKSDMPNTLTARTKRTLQRSAFDVLYERRYFLQLMVQVAGTMEEITEVLNRSAYIEESRWEAIWTLESILGCPDPFLLFTQLGSLDELQFPEPPASQDLSAYVRRVGELMQRWQAERTAPPIERLYEMAGEVAALPPPETPYVWVTPGSTLPS